MLPTHVASCFQVCSIALVTQNRSVRQRGTTPSARNAESSGACRCDPEFQLPPVANKQECWEMWTLSF